MTVVQGLVLAGAAAAQIVALVLIVKRHGIPRSPQIFHLPLVVSMPAGATSFLALLWIMLPNTQGVVIGWGWEAWVTLLAGSELTTFGWLCFYTGWWHFRGRYKYRSRAPVDRRQPFDNDRSNQ